jgi:hypothetical protein
MRLSTICVAVLALAADGAFAQEIPPFGSRLLSTTGQVTRQAPVGHRQPTLNDLPPDIVHKELPPETAPTQESQKDDRRLKTCRGWAGGPPTLQVGPSCEAAASGSVVAGRNKEACLSDETAARDTLKQHWPKYPAIGSIIGVLLGYCHGWCVRLEDSGWTPAARTFPSKILGARAL